jgi:hypothetical protein
LAASSDCRAKEAVARDPQPNFLTADYADYTD